MDQEGSQTPEAAKSEPEASPRHRVSLSWLVWPFMGMFFYVLSVGPVARVSEAYDLPNKHPGIETACELIYAPLLALADRSSAATRFLVWYLRFWHVPVPVGK